MTATVIQKFDLRKYSRLVSKVANLVIKTKEEFERSDAEIGRLPKKGYDKSLRRGKKIAGAAQPAD